MIRQPRALPSGLALFLGAITLVACGNEAGPPHPDPLPDVTRARASALLKPPLGPETGAVTLIGLPGCVGGMGTVTIESLGATYTATSSAQGSFKALGIVSKVGENLAIRYGTSDAVLKAVREVGVMAPRPPEPIPGAPPITSLGGGRVRVQGHTTAGANMTVFGINERTSEVAFATSDASGNFQLELVASSGDMLSIYDDDDPLGGAWQLTAP